MCFNLRLGEESQGARDVCIVSFGPRLILHIIEFAFPFLSVSSLPQRWNSTKQELEIS